MGAATSIVKVHEFEVVNPDVAFGPIRRDARIQANFKRARIGHRRQCRIQVEVNLVPFASRCVAGGIQHQDGQSTGLTSAKHLQSHDESHVALVVEFEVDRAVTREVVELLVGGGIQLGVGAVHSDVPRGIAFKDVGSIEGALHLDVAVAALQKPLGAFVKTMDEFWSDHKVLFGVLFGTMLAVDLFGTSAVVAKEKLLQIFRQKLAEAYDLEDAGAQKPTSAGGLPDPDVIDAEFTEKDQALQEKFDRMKNLAGIKKVL